MSTRYLAERSHAHMASRLAPSNPDTHLEIIALLPTTKGPLQADLTLRSLSGAS
jgi:hypothetical protein